MHHILRSHAESQGGGWNGPPIQEPKCRTSQTVNRRGSYGGRGGGGRGLALIAGSRTESARAGCSIVLREHSEDTCHIMSLDANQRDTTCRKPDGTEQESAGRDETNLQSDCRDLQADRKPSFGQFGIGLRIRSVH